MSTSQISPGSHWMNVHSGRTDTVREVAGGLVHLLDPLDLSLPSDWPVEKFLENWREIRK